MNKALHADQLLSWVFAAILITIGLANMWWVHPVPGLAFLLFGLLFTPVVNAILKNKLGFGIPLGVKVVLFIVLVMFTLGVSDLGDMIDKL